MNPKILIALAIASLASSGAAQNLSEGESNAIVEFSQAFTSPVIVWDPYIPLCNQTGITCQQNGDNYTVISISLPNSQLNGTIPNSIGNLGNLQTLNLGNNLITGTIPNQITDLSALVTLDLSNNQLYGTIPNEISNLQQLTSLNLSNNRLAGSFPANFNLQTLQSLYLLGTNALCPYPNYTSVPNNDYQDSSNCQICNGNSCLNGGQCIANQDQSFDCVCPANISGEFCENTTAAQPTNQPTDQPTDQPTAVPTEQPTDQPTNQPTDQPTSQPTDEGGSQGNSAGHVVAGVAPFLLTLGVAAFSFFA